jgi:hypothetical protein
MSLLGGVELFVATPCYACKLNAAYVASLLQLQGACMRRGISMAVQLLGNESLVQRGRNILIEQFAMSGAENLLFLDADLAFSVEAILDRLLPFARANRDAVVTGVYAKKSFDWERIDASNTTEPIHAQTLCYNINVVEQAEIQDGFVKVLDSATGAMMIPREVVAKMKDAYPELDCVNDISPGKHPVKEYCAIMDCMIDPVSKRYLSEDYSFSRRFQQIGGSIYVDLTSGYCHVGTHSYAGNIKERFNVTFSV